MSPARTAIVWFLFPHKPYSRSPSRSNARTGAERQRAYRARKAGGEPSVRYRKPKDRRTRQRRWRDAVQEVFDVRADCQVWLDDLPQG